MRTKIKNPPTIDVGGFFAGKEGFAPGEISPTARCGQGSSCGLPLLLAVRKSDGLQILGRALAGAFVLHDLEAELLAFDDGAEAGALHSRNMDENVRSAVVGLDEAEAFGRVEELDSSSNHDDFLIAHRKYVRQAFTQGKR